MDHQVGLSNQQVKVLLNDLLRRGSINLAHHPEARDTECCLWVLLQHVFHDVSQCTSLQQWVRNYQC